MKLKENLKIVLYVIFTINLLAGCISTHSNFAVTTTIETPRFPQTLIPVQTKTTLQTPQLTPTLIPTLTPITITSTTELSLTQIPEIKPTLTADERILFEKELLKTNADCKLPCWWGIEPGNTSWQDAKIFLEDLGARIGSEPLKDGTNLHGIGGFDFDKELIYNRYGFTERNGIVESIDISSEGYANPKGFQSAWSHYSPKNVLVTYGQPSRVWLKSTSSHLGDSGMEGYILWLYYDRLGFVVKYSGGVKEQSIYHFCPSMDNEKDIGGIEFLLQSPSNTDPLDRLDELDELDKKYIHTIEEAAGISVEEFYNLFTQKDKPACFDTPRNNWPP